MPARIFVPRALSRRRSAGPVLAPGAMHAWALSETGAAARADSIGSLDWTANGAPGTRTGAFTGSTALDLNGTTQWLSLGDEANLEPADRNWTFACWLILDSTAGTQTILAKTGATDTYHFRMVGTTLESWWKKADDSGWITNTWATALTTGVWYPIRFWHDSGSDTVNVQVANGAINSLAIPAGGVRNGANGVTAGSLNGASNFLDGGLDGLVLWPDKVLSNAEWLDYQAGIESRAALSTLVTDSLLFSYRLNEAVLWHDEVAGLDLTATNGPVSAAGYVGNAVDLESGSSQYLSRADHANFSLADTDWTVGAVVKAESLPANPNAAKIVTKYQYSAGKREWGMDYSGVTERFRGYISDSADTVTSIVTANSLGAPVAGTWYRILFGHVAATSTLWIRVNAGTKDEQAGVTTPHDSTAAFEIGSENAGAASYWDGLVDAVSGWRRALTAAEEAAWFAHPQYPFDAL